MHMCQDSSFKKPNARLSLIVLFTPAPLQVVASGRLLQVKNFTLLHFASWFPPYQVVPLFIKFECSQKSDARVLILSASHPHLYYLYYRIELDTTVDFL